MKEINVVDKGYELVPGFWLLEEQLQRTERQFQEIARRILIKEQQLREKSLQVQLQEQSLQEKDYLIRQREQELHLKAQELKRQARQLQESNQQLQEVNSQLQELAVQLEDKKRFIEVVLNTRSYRWGQVITWPGRMLRQLDFKSLLTKSSRKNPSITERREQPSPINSR